MSKIERVEASTEPVEKNGKTKFAPIVMIKYSDGTIEEYMHTKTRRTRASAISAAYKRIAKSKLRRFILH